MQGTNLLSLIERKRKRKQNNLISSINKSNSINSNGIKKKGNNNEICEFILPFNGEDTIFVNDNPKFEFKEDIVKKNISNSEFNLVYEIFNSIIDNNPYLVLSNNSYFSLDIIDITNNNIINRLKGHEITITKIRYFLNWENKKEYILSSSFKNIITWDIQNSYNIEYKINIFNNSFYTYNSLLLFNIKNENIIISSCSGWETTKIYSLNNHHFTKEIKNTISNFTFNIIYWYNKKDNCSYFIEICKDFIYIYNITKDKFYVKLYAKHNGGEKLLLITCFESGFLYNDEYLCVSSADGCICIYNLIKKELERFMNINGSKLYDIIMWDERYIITADFKNGSVKIIDFEQLRIITDINGNRAQGVKYIKKFYHPIYGNSLLTGNTDRTLKLWIC